MEKLFFRLWFIGSGLLLLLCTLMLTGLGPASAGSASPIAPVPREFLYPNHWVLVVPPLFLVFEVWVFWLEWKRQNSPKKSKVKVGNHAPQFIFLQPEPAPRTKKRAAREREKVLA